ncbi:hypothetical protein Pelo_11218 [Pelomyxa schiedti]|nr:hypothetical protein Pelo_11218 [Pelomyxa schiedti]
MKVVAILFAFFAATVVAYTHSSAVDYASKWWSSCNHDCSGAYTTCSPWSYWGSEECGYESHGGDCANFVSQCLLAGGHDSLTKSPCRGYPCGKEEVGAENLDQCLYTNYGWTHKCGSKLAPPDNIVAGDVAIFHTSSCSDYSAHATLVVYRSGTTANIACHSSEHFNYSYTNYLSSMPYVDWLHHD